MQRSMELEFGMRYAEYGQDLDLKQNGEIEYENKNEQSTNHRIS